jgi:hypothetical protein
VSGYRERPADDARLAGAVACVWSTPGGAAGPDLDRVLPDGCIDVVVVAGGEPFVAGPDTTWTPADPAAGAVAGVRFAPGRAPAVIGVPASELRDRQASLGDLWGPSAVAALVDAVGAAGDDRFAWERALETAVATAVADPDADSRVDPLVDGVVRTVGTRPVAGLAEHLGVGERRLRRRSVAAFGYGPKTLERILRFRRFLALADLPRPGGLAALAVEAGYADQAHLTRECVRLSGLTPGRLLGR